MTIVHDDSRVINKLEDSLTDDARVVIYDRHMFIVQATALWLIKLMSIACSPITILSITHSSISFYLLAHYGLHILYLQVECFTDLATAADN
jgi:hypothetical protein